MRKTTSPPINKLFECRLIHSYFTQSVILLLPQLFIEMFPLSQIWPLQDGPYFDMLPIHLYALPYFLPQMFQVHLVLFGVHHFSKGGCIFLKVYMLPEFISILRFFPGFCDRNKKVKTLDVKFYSGYLSGSFSPLIEFEATYQKFYTVKFMK